MATTRRLKCLISQRANVVGSEQAKPTGGKLWQRADIVGAFFSATDEKGQVIKKPVVLSSPVPFLCFMERFSGRNHQGLNCSNVVGMAIHGGCRVVHKKQS
uniref:Uncharacterized protein n=1 Tax=Spongospora subterranea TaxID=70186 RepID=A0A0H5RV03_9EUKA|eukprot:CRZ12579.1 hypothetical protein [Spongospora subterranea]